GDRHSRSRRTFRWAESVDRRRDLGGDASDVVVKGREPQSPIRSEGHFHGGHRATGVRIVGHGATSADPTDAVALVGLGEPEGIVWARHDVVRVISAGERERLHHAGGGDTANRWGVETAPGVYEPQGPVRS